MLFMQSSGIQIILLCSYISGCLLNENREKKTTIANVLGHLRLSIFQFSYLYGRRYGLHQRATCL